MGGVEDVGPELPVGLEREQRAGEDRERDQHEQAVTSVFQTKIGIRNIVMPGARMQMIVVMKLTAPRMVPRPAIHRPMIHRSPPTPGERTASDSGV